MPTDHKETLKQYINAFINDEQDKAEELLASVLQSKMSEKIAGAKQDDESPADDQETELDVTDEVEVEDDVEDEVEDLDSTDTE